MGSAVDGPSKFLRHARDRRRVDLHRKADGRVYRARSGQRQNAVAIPGRFKRQFNGHHIYAQRPAICDRRVGTWWNPGDALCRWKNADRWIDMDFRVVSRLATRIATPCSVDKSPWRSHGWVGRLATDGPLASRYLTLATRC